MWFRYLTILILLLCFCWLFKPVFTGVLRSVISSLNELEKNTWDVVRVRNIKKWLIENFEFAK